ncbi:MAG: triphosphoribosyl-dephospho-CoA synthase [Candidatus Aquilonibacter sp.]
MYEAPRPHDLVRLTSRAVARIADDGPAWVAASLKRAPWATVRRAHVAGGVAIGVRGAGRGQRLASVVQAEDVDAVVTPETLAATRPARDHRAFAALRTVVYEARARGMSAAPIGAAGFELATGVAALHDESDLDVLVCVQPSHGALPSFARTLAELPLRIDVEIAFGDGYAAALEEVLRGGALMVKTPSGPRLLPPFSPAHAAVQALIAEAELTPKPALVDRRGNGAHDDLSLELLVQSAQALGATFDAAAAVARDAAIDDALRERLGAIGRDGERTMLELTHGINTHRGAIWSLGLLVAAHASTGSREPQAIARVAGQIASLPDAAGAAVYSHGAQACERFGVRGARGEAQAGFPHALNCALPALRAARARGAPESVARVDALLAIMSSLDDTCLLHRGGRAALYAAQSGAAAVLRAGGIGEVAGMEIFAALEATLLTLRASPGGAADLLAGALFLDSIERGTWA